MIFERGYNWHFTKPELYKHFFIVFDSQVSGLPAPGSHGRIEILKQSIHTALTTYRKLEQAGILLDDNSNGTHLNLWLAGMNMFEKYLGGNRL